MASYNDLYEEFKSLSPRERNERLQAMYSAKLAEAALSDSPVTQVTIELLKAVAKSFDISLSYSQMDESNDTDAF